MALDYKQYPSWCENELKSWITSELSNNTSTGVYGEYESIPTNPAVVVSFSKAKQQEPQFDVYVREMTVTIVADNFTDFDNHRQWVFEILLELVQSSHQWQLDSFSSEAGEKILQCNFTVLFTA